VTSLYFDNECNINKAAGSTFITLSPFDITRKEINKINERKKEISWKATSLPFLVFHHRKTNRTTMPIELVLQQPETRGEKKVNERRTKKKKPANCSKPLSI
jgi:hypothetical protein